MPSPARVTKASECSPRPCSAKAPRKSACPRPMALHVPAMGAACTAVGACPVVLGVREGVGVALDPPSRGSSEEPQPAVTARARIAAANARECVEI